MKKSILIFCIVLTTFSLTAYGFMNWKNSNQVNLDLVYNVDSRFMATITKEDLHQATSVLDIVPEAAEGWWKVSFQTVAVTVLKNDGEVREVGNEKTLNAAQIRLLQAADYSTNFYIKARGKDNHPETGQIEDYVYYFTIIPENEAEYSMGYDALIAYLKENSRDQTAMIKEDQLQPGKVSFTVTIEGTIADVKLSSTSGYPMVDEALIELVRNIPEKWKPATNSKGENVEQELVFFFWLTRLLS